MIAKTGKWVMACGPASKDAEYKQVGEKNTPLAKFGIKVDETKNELGQSEARWLNCDCWGKMSGIGQRIEKGDVVLAIGTLQKSESNGKTYENLRCEFVSIQGKTGLSITNDPGGAPEGFEEYTGPDAWSSSAAIAERPDPDDLPF